MGNTELIILLAAVFVWGVFSGMLILQIVCVDPLRRDRDDARRAARRAIASSNRLADAVHRGTPYRPETTTAAQLPRDDEWSKKVPPLEVVQ